MANMYFRNQNNLICDFLIGSKTSFSISPCHIAEHYDEQIGTLKDSYETLQKLTVRIDLGSPSLVTSIRIIMTEQESAEKKFTLLEILGNQLGENTEFQRLLRLDSLQDQGGELSTYGASLKTLQTQKVKNQMKIQAYGVTKVLQISYLINKNEILNNSSQEQSQDGCLVMYQDQNLEKKIDLEQGSEEFKKLFDSIQIYGYSLFLSPPSNQGIHLLNISNLFQKNNRKEESIETDIILGYSLMSQRKYIQAAEIFKRCSLYFYQLYEHQKKSNLQDNPQQSTPIQTFQDTQKPLTFSPNQKNDFNEDTFNQTNIFSNTNYQGGGTSNQKLLRAAKLELLVADCIRQPQLQNQKVQAYLRATEYFQGQRLNINLTQQNADHYTNILILCPYLCKFLLRTLDERIDPLRISAIKGIEFLIENLGCTISNQLPQILKQVILTYPSIPDFSMDHDKQFDDEEDYQEEDEDDNEDIMDRYEDGNFSEIDHESNEEEGSQKRSKKQKKGNGGFSNFPKSLQSQASINSKVIFDMYHHLLDQFLNLLASASSQILRSIFNDVISTQLFNNEVAHDVKIYLCKITDKIISICQGDLNVTPQFITNMMNYLLNTQQQQQFTNQFKQHLERTWDNIKQKLLSNLELSQANRIVDLISDNLQNILDNQGEVIEKSSKRESQIDQDVEFNFWIEITSIVLQREKRTQENLPTNFARYYKKLEMSQENLNLKILIQPYLQILELTLAHPQGIDTFKLIWSIIIDILTSASSKQQTEYTLGEVTYSILNKTKQFIANHPPPVLQLDALIIIISSLPQKEIDIGLKREMYDFLQIILEYVPHSIFEEIFFLVDCLIEKIDQLDYNLIEKILSVLIDQYTMKNKTQKKVTANFISKIMKSESQSKSISYFQWILEICLIKNIEPTKDDLNPVDIIQAKGQKIQALKARQSKKNSDSKQFEKEYDIFIDKLSFLQDCFDHLKQTHFVALISKNQDSIVSDSIIKLINSGDSRVRMKGFSIIKKIHEHFVELSEGQIRQIEKVLGNYLNSSFLSKQNQFVPSFQDEWFNSSKNESDKKSTQGNKNQSKISTSMNSKYDQSAILDQTTMNNKQQKEDVDQSKSKKKVFSFAKIMVTKLIIACLKASFENLKDPKQQFNSLVLMDQFFQNLFGGPDLESELKFANQLLNPSKHQKAQKKVLIIDLETYEFTIEQYFDYDNEWYLHMRLNQILKFWPLLQNLVNSPWSNVRSLTYGVICNWVRIDLNHYKSSNQKKFLQILFRLLLSLLQSKESECRTGGLNILGSLCGLSYNFDDKVDEMKNYLHFFRRHENLISLAIWETVYDIQSDWDVTNQAAAMIIIQICAPRDSIRHFFRLKKEDINMRNNYHSYSQNNIQSHLSSKENRSVTPIMFQGKEEDQIVNDSGIMTRSVKQSNHQSSQNQVFGNNENTPSRGMFNQLAEDEKISNIYNNNNISNDSIGADQPQLQSEEELSEVNIDQDDSQDASLSKNQNQDDLFWFDTASEKEIRDMISMFKGEQKPPVTLWIERDTYNTEHKPEGTTTTEVITYTMNEEEDAGIYGYFDEVGINQGNPNANQTNNNNSNHNNITEEYIQQQQQQFQQMKKNNNLGLDFLQERNKEVKLFSKQDSSNANQGYQLDERGQEQIKDKQIPQNKNYQGSQQVQQDGKANNKKFNKFDDEDLDYDKLGIIEMEDDEPFIDDYEKKYQEYKKQKNPSQYNNNNQKQASESNRPQTGRQVQRNTQSKQDHIDDNQKYNTSQQPKTQGINKIENVENNEKSNNSNKSSATQNQVNQIKDQSMVTNDPRIKNQVSDSSSNNQVNQGNSVKQENQIQKDTLKAYKQHSKQDGQQQISSYVQEQKNSQQNQQQQLLAENKQDKNYQNYQYYEEEYHDEDDEAKFDYDEDDDDEEEEEIEEDIQEDENDQDLQNLQFKQSQHPNIKYNNFIKIEHNNNNQQNQTKKDNSRYASNYSNNVSEKNSQQVSQQQNSSGKRLKDDLQSMNQGESEAQKQALFNQRMHFREAMLSDENKESLSYTQSSQPNQKRRDTFEVTLSFSDSSIFRDEHTDKTLTKEDEPSQIQQQFFNNKVQDDYNIQENTQKQGNNQVIGSQFVQHQQQKSLTPQNKKEQQIQTNNYFSNQASTKHQQKQEQNVNKFNQIQNQNSTVKSPSPNNHNQTIKAPLSYNKQDNENSNMLNRTSPLPSTHQKSSEKQNLPPNNTPRINQQSKSPANKNTNNQQDNNLMKQKINNNLNTNQPNSNDANYNGQNKKNNKNTYSPQERGDNISIQQKQQSPYKQQVQETVDKQRLNYHHSNNTIFSSDNTQLQLLNVIQNQTHPNKSSQGGSKSPSSTKNQQKQPRQSPQQNNALLKHLLKHPTSTKNQQLDTSDESSSKQKSKSRSKEKNQQGIQKHQAFQNNLELNIEQGQEFVVASSASSKSQGRQQKVDFFRKNNQYQTLSNSHSPYQTMNIQTGGGSSSTKHQKSTSKSRSKSNGKKKNGLKTSSVTPSGFFKNRTPSHSPPTSTGKNNILSRLRLQGSNSGGKSRSLEKNTSSNLSSTFNNTISSVINGINNNSSTNPSKPPLKTNSANTVAGNNLQNTISNANKNNLNLHSIDKLYKTDFLSRLLDSTKSNVSSKKTTNITPKSCKTKISSSRNSKSKENNNSTIQNNNNQSYYSNQNNPNTITINSQSYNNMSNSNFSFAGNPQKDSYSPQQSAQFEDEVHQQFSYDDTVYGNIGGGGDSKNCTLDLADAFQNIDNQQMIPLNSQSLNNSYNMPNQNFNEQSQQKYLISQIAQKNNQLTNKIQQGLPLKQNIQISNNQQIRSSRRGSEGNYLPQNNLDLKQNTFIHYQQQPLHQNFIIQHQHQQVVLQNQQYPQKSLENKENHFENSADELLDVLTKQRNQRSNSSKSKKRSISGGKNSSQQSQTNNIKNSSNSSNKVKMVNISQQVNEKFNKFEPYKQPLSPNRKKKQSPNQRPQSSIYSHNAQQINQQQLSVSSIMNSNHFSSTSQDSSYLQGQIKQAFNQTAASQTSHNNSFQSYNKPPLVKKQQQNNSREKESNLQNSGIFNAGNVLQSNNQTNSNNHPFYVQQGNSQAQKKKKKIQFNQNHSFDDSLVNTTL